MSQKIRIKLKSYDHNLVDKSAEKIVKTVKATGAVVSGPIPLPTHKRIYTVLRSPHVNKKAREQFQLCAYKRLLDIYSSNSKTVDFPIPLEVPVINIVFFILILFDFKFRDKKTAKSIEIAVIEIFYRKVLLELKSIGWKCFVDFNFIKNHHVISFFFRRSCFNSERHYQIIHFFKIRIHQCFVFLFFF